MDNKKLQGQTIQEQLSITNAFVQPALFSLSGKPDYFLCEAEFKDLQNPPRTLDWVSSGLIMLGFSLLLTSLSRYIAESLNFSSKVEPYELIGGFIATGLGVLIWIFGYFIVPNPKRDLMKKIENHFSKNQRHQHFMSKSDK